MKTPLRWLLVAPAAIVAYFLVVVTIVLISLTAGQHRPVPRDKMIELFSNVLAAFVSVGVAMIIAPTNRGKVAFAWITLIFLIACYGNLINGAGVVLPVEAYRNILIITAGAVAGFAATKAWLKHRNI